MSWSAPAFRVLSKLRPAKTCSALLLCVVLTAAAGCGGDGRDREAPAVPVPTVEAVRARSGALPLEERLSGTVKARNQVAIRPEIEAPITAVLVQNGATVERGQPLVRLDGSRLSEQLRQAEASLRLAEAAAAESRARVAELEAGVFRSRKLADEELISDLELETQEAQLDAVRASADQAVARVEQAAATVEERRADLGRTVVRAPVAGRVGQRDAEVGMLADPGSQLFVIGDLDHLRVEIPLTEAMLAYVREGQPVRIKPPGGEPIRATLSRISPFLAAGSFSTVGEIDLENPAGAAALHPGTFVTVDVLYGESERATLVPTSAAWEDPRTGIRGVYVLQQAAALTEPRNAPEGEAGETQSHDDTLIGETQPVGELSAEAFPVEFRPVEVLAEGRNALGVSGIEEGEWVVTVGQQLLASSAAEALTARVRPVRWERVVDLQELQREDLLQAFLAKQQRLARERGARPPSSQEFLRGQVAG